MNNGSGGIQERYSQEAYNVWKLLQKQIHKIISRIINFNSSYEFEDYVQEAFIACHKAVCCYNFFKENNKNNNDNHRKNNGKDRQKFIVIDGKRLKMTDMRVDVYAYWYIQKRLYKIADSGEVVFDLYSPDEQYIKTISNSEYRRNRKKFKKEGYRANPVNIIKDLEFFEDDEKNNSGFQEFIDASYIGFNPEMQELLKEDLYKVYELNGRSN